MNFNFLRSAFTLIIFATCFLLHSIIKFGTETLPPLCYCKCWSSRHSENVRYGKIETYTYSRRICSAGNRSQPHFIPVYLQVHLSLLQLLTSLPDQDEMGVCNSLSCTKNCNQIVVPTFDCINRSNIIPFASSRTCDARFFKAPLSSAANLGSPSQLGLPFTQQ